MSGEIGRLGDWRETGFLRVLRLVTINLEINPVSERTNH
jgi:hypothetical protein